jgi:hypothetical protein
MRSQKGANMETKDAASLTKFVDEIEDLSLWASSHLFRGQGRQG